MEPAGKELTIWTARLAAVLYLCWLTFAFRGQRDRARLLSTLAFAIYLLHTVFAFEFVYHWSHSIALRETARQTRELFGVDWGGGLYLNYLFTGVWLADCLEAWLSPRRWNLRPAWAAAAFHLFLAFMWVNATLTVWIARAGR